MDLPLNPEDYAIAVRLHDVGKINVPESIIMKAGPLTPAERETVERHPQDGFGYLEHLLRNWSDGPRSEYMRLFLEAAMEITLNHHERYDGTGYPRRLRELDIPLSARLFSPIDVYDALVSERPYKHAWSESETRRFIEDHVGTMFDPEAVELLFAVLDEGIPTA
ncbi:response regulator receiver modulated metal dependent phosphohydrolase [mine drainage metagenome]|uniref:Response regulator receiver modulated metal dependent phosphohydrolase n=1 Tax=mine drainage metagenome TaxID=410659 RepID=T0YWZ4_9ZZZZ